MAVEAAREKIAALINAEPNEIHFTSGATESNFLALQGIAQGYRRGKESAHLVTIATEHKATLNPLKALSKQGFEVTVLPVDRAGQIDIDLLADTMTSDTSLLAISAVNNETGVMPDLAIIAALCKEKNVHLHIDAAQAYGKLPLDVKALDCATMSISAHKCYGPKGIGALYVRAQPKIRLADVLSAGTQGVRSGTLATPLIIGFGTAAEQAGIQAAEIHKQLCEYRSLLLSHITAADFGCTVEITGEAADPSKQFPGIINVRFVGIRNIAIMQLLEQHIAISAGSACNSANAAPSHVLTAMHKTDIEAGESIRISMGKFTTTEEVLQLVVNLKIATNFL
jgi:cysteine desulfurase